MNPGLVFQNTFWFGLDLSFKLRIFYLFSLLFLVRFCCCCCVRFAVVVVFGFAVVVVRIRCCCGSDSCVLLLAVLGYLALLCGGSVHVYAVLVMEICCCS